MQRAPVTNHCGVLFSGGKQTLNAGALSVTAGSLDNTGGHIASMNSTTARSGTSAGNATQFAESYKDKTGQRP